jgi:hypothetical protein
MPKVGGSTIIFSLNFGKIDHLMSVTLMPPIQFETHNQICTQLMNMTPTVLVTMSTHS